MPAAWGLPLFRKELVEQSARKRTYVIRSVYAVLIFFLFYMFFLEIWRNGQFNPLNVIGEGRNIFIFIVMVQFIGIYLFMPALMSGVLTYEKEKGSLNLLFMTKLRPGEILLEKFLSRLLPMITFLLLSLPLMSIAYSLGGVSAELMKYSSIMLFLCAFQIGALALMFSAWCRTTTGALVLSYLFMVAYALITIFLGEFMNFSFALNEYSPLFHLIAPLSLQFSLRTGMGLLGP
ncbi:MAG: ABC transporter permease subunit, partial [Verrucomicrobiota bacterium]